MHALQDPTKKTSINSLLNPQEYPGHLGGLGPSPLVQNHAPPNSHPPYYQPGYDNNSYNLRAASWEANDPHRRKATITHQVHDHRHYPEEATNGHVEHHYAANSYAYNQPPSMARQRADEPQSYGGSGAVWPAQQRHDSSNMPYGAPGIAPMFSEERTALSSQYPVQPQSYSPTYEEHHPQRWQNTERVSVRLAARETSRPPMHTDRSASPYYGPYHSPEYSQMPVPPLHPEPSNSNPSSSKRALPESEVTPAPKPKRPKAKAKTTSSETPSKSTAPASRRGYNAKKRSEAAFISAQNDAIQKAQRDEINPSGGMDDPQAPRQDSGMTFIPELQSARCMSNRYRPEEFPRCVSCTRRWAGDTCRFQGIRYFMRDAAGKLVGISFCESHSVALTPKMDFPTSWNRKVEREPVRRSKLSIARALLPTLRQEQQHLKAEEIVRRPRESEVRVTCDTCMTSLFSTSFMCRLCGREVCNECFQQVRELTQAPQNATDAELKAFTARREKYAHANPFFLSCLKRNEHSMSDFTPVTRFVGAELDKTIQEMQEILDKESADENALASKTTAPTDAVDSDIPTDANYEHPQPQPPPSGVIPVPQPQPAPIVRPEPPPVSTGTTYSAYCASPPGVFPDPLAFPVYDDYIPSNAPEHVTSIPTHPIQIIPANFYDPHKVSTSSRTPSPAFASLWRLGLPLLVKGVLERFKIRWNPQYFIERYGDQSCLIIECQTEKNERVNVAQFFQQFGQYKDRTESWKLKDWPPTAEFKSTFPELFEDFSNAVPVPDYVRRDGVFNIGSHFPSNAIGPDLGPKMYNAMASSQEAGSKGTTRLHMDMADALNVMLYSSNCEDGSEGYAVWDLFRAEDSDKIRAFLRKRFVYGPPPPATPASVSGQPEGEAGKGAPAKGTPVIKPNIHARHDPIHGQQFYLDVELRRALWEEYGVKSYRVYQRPGDGVFIPAGCAHQVANMADCIKIATDFVSPENIDRCERLTKEFREQNQSKAWKEDVLQLRTMMWFAWQSCSILEAGLDKEDAEKEKEQAAAAALAAAGMISRNSDAEREGDAGGGSGLLIEGG